MAAQCRMGDIGVGVCFGHESPTPYVTAFLTGQGAQSEGRWECVVGTIGIATCGHPTVALTGATGCSNSGLAPHRVGDAGTSSGPGPYVATTGSPMNQVN